MYSVSHSSSITGPFAVLVHIDLQFGKVKLFSRFVLNERIDVCT